MALSTDAIKRLVQRFNHQLEEQNYNETLLRIDFVKRLFVELDWDTARYHAAG